MSRTCYAAALGGCSPKLSREHYVSETLLDALTTEDGYFTVSGLRWAEGRTLQIRPANLVAWILCETHNNALSRLDAAAGRFFNCINFIYSYVAEESSDNHVYLVNGDYIERWMLKILCGLAVSRQDVEGETRAPTWVPPVHWVRILFGQEPFPPGWGLYFFARKDAVIRPSNTIQIQLLYGSDNEINGIQVQLRTFLLQLYMFEPPMITAPKGIRLTEREYCHRPANIVVPLDSSEQKLIFDWINKGSGNSLRLQNPKSVR